MADGSNPWQQEKQATVATTDPWSVTKGDVLIYQPTGQRGKVIGWDNPVTWDMDEERYVPPDPGETDLFYAKVWLCGPDGEVWSCTDLDHLYGEGAEILGYPEPPLKFLSYEDMTALQEPDWLIDGLIMAETSALLFGPSNTNKTFLAVDIVCSFASGISEWHGQRINDDLSGNVLYIATEGALGVATQRIPGWMEAHRIPLDQRGGIKVYPQEIALDDDKAVDDLLRSCAIDAASRSAGYDPQWCDPAYAFRLVIIDIFGSSMKGADTEHATAQAWVRNVQRIIREMKCAVLVVAHTGWADESRLRGHSHFWGSFDTRLKVEGDAKNRTVVLKVERHKDAESIGRWGFRMETVPVPDSDKTTLIPRLADDVKAPSRVRESGKPSVALQALTEVVGTVGSLMTGPGFPSCPVAHVDQWGEACRRRCLSGADTPDAAKKAFQRAKKQLLESGQVHQFGSYVWPAPPVLNRGTEGDRRGHVPIGPPGDGQGTLSYKSVPCPP